MNIEKEINIIPLSKKYLKSAIKLVDSVFDEEDEVPKVELEASIDEKCFDEYVKEYESDVIEVEYFIVVDENEKVMGIIGLYLTKEDYKDTYWGGWFCVHKKHRGKGVGSALLNYIINEARNRGKKYLCLYTSTDKSETKAQVLYEKNGFYIIRRIYKKGYQILYRRKEL